MGPNARRALGLLCRARGTAGPCRGARHDLTENALLTGALRGRLVRRASSTGAGARDFAEEIIARFDVRTPGPHVAARALSGGNLQKFVIGREICSGPKVLVVNQPTWGVDAAAAAAIRQALMDLAAGRRGGGGDQPGPRRVDGDRRPLRRAERGAAERAAPDARADVDEIGLMLGGATTWRCPC
jgi:general nucleoside transport system ATP-binding protein